MNEHAQALGRMGRGKKHEITEMERKARVERIAIARRKRWEGHVKGSCGRKRRKTEGEKPMIRTVVLAG